MKSDSSIKRIKEELGNEVYQYLLKNYCGQFIFIPDKENKELVIKNAVAKYIDIDDLNDDMQYIVDIYGIEFAIDLMLKLGGRSIYVKQIHACQGAMLKVIKDKLNEGKKISRIAKEMEMTERRLKNILGIK